MDRLFLDANVLFSAAYRSGAAVARLWTVGGVELVSSRYAAAEAERNLPTDEQLVRLYALLDQMTVLGHEVDTVLVNDVLLPEKDLPILASAVAGQCTHLITGDVRHFGAYFGKRLHEVLIVLPADYIRSRQR